MTSAAQASYPAADMSLCTQTLVLADAFTRARMRATTAAAPSALAATRAFTLQRLQSLMAVAAAAA